MVRSSKNFNNYEDWNRAAKDAGYTVRGPFTPSVGRGPSHFSAADSGGHIQGDFTPDENSGQLYMYESVDEDIQDLKRRAGIITEQQMISVTPSDIQQVIDTLSDGNIGEAVDQLESMLGESPQQWANLDRQMGLRK